MRGTERDLRTFDFEPIVTMLMTEKPRPHLSQGAKMVEKFVDVIEELDFKLQWSSFLSTAVIGN